jgi:hypothetical protein
MNDSMNVFDHLMKETILSRICMEPDSPKFGNQRDDKSDEKMTLDD